MADPASLAHVLRRLTFGPRPGQVEALGELTASELVERLLTASPLSPADPELGTDHDYDVLVRWWLDVMAQPDAGVHERMVWFWHGHLTSSLAKAEPALMLRQHKLLRTHALGNYRELMQAITIDAAMLQWLDGADSHADQPNENYARESMELFTLGRGNYTEADVRSGSYAFSGWTINGDHGNKVEFDAEHGPTETRPFLGRSVSSAKEAIDAMCDHDACAPFVAAKVYRYFTGADPAADVLGSLAATFRSSGLSIAALVGAVVRQASFLQARANRPRTGLEFFLAARVLLDTELQLDVLERLGQQPFEPPNVAGWPGNARWISAGATFAKAQLAFDGSDDTPTTDAADPVAAILARAGIYDASDATRAVLRDAAAAVESRRERASVLHALTVASPEFSIA